MELTEFTMYMLILLIIQLLLKPIKMNIASFRHTHKSTRIPYFKSFLVIFLWLLHNHNVRTTLWLGLLLMVDAAAKQFLIILLEKKSSMRVIIPIFINSDHMKYL